MTQGVAPANTRTEEAEYVSVSSGEWNAMLAHLIFSVIILFIYFVAEHNRYNIMTINMAMFKINCSHATGPKRSRALNLGLRTIAILFDQCFLHQTMLNTSKLYNQIKQLSKIKAIKAIKASKTQIETSKHQKKKKYCIVKESKEICTYLQFYTILDSFLNWDWGMNQKFTQINMF